MMTPGLGVKMIFVSELKIKLSEKRISVPSEINAVPNCCVVPRFYYSSHFV